MKTTYINLLVISIFALTAWEANAQIKTIENEDPLMEEIIVTANKREELLIDIPMAVVTMTGTELEARGIDTIQDLSFAVPGMTMREDGPGSYQIFLRGIANAYGGGALVSIYQDEIPMVLTGSEILPTRVLDLARIEVLKGPQGTLYGQGAVGGAVRYITNRPILNSFEGYLEGQVLNVSSGDWGESLTGVFNIPVAQDKLAFRIATEFGNGGGWQDQPDAGIYDGNGEDLRNLRFQALWKPIEEMDVFFTYGNYHAEYQLGQGYEQPDRTVYVATDSALELIPKIWDYELYNLEAHYDLGSMELISSTSYSEMDLQYPFSYYGGPETVYEGALAGYSHRYNPGNQFSQEFRLTSMSDSPLQWTVGMFYRDMQKNLDIPVGMTDYYGLWPFDYYTANTSKSWSLFADASYEINDKWSIGIGTRYFSDKQTQVLLPNPEEESTFDSFDPRVYVSWTPEEDRNIYASVTKGFRSGGFNGHDYVTGEELPDFDPETIWSYELGYKATLLDGALFMEFAGYYNDYEDMLRRGLILVNTAVGLQSFTSNIGKAEIKGLEAAFSWRATKNLTLNFSGSYIDAEVTRLDAEGSANIEGDPIDYVPEFSFSAGGNYAFDWSSEIPGYFRASYNYRDEMSYVDRTSFPAENLPQYSDKIGLIDARLGTAFNNVYAELFVQNLTDVNKYIDPYGAWNNANRTRPRTIGIKVGVTF
jgi:iron complex outermembrane recepter protein